MIIQMKTDSFHLSKREEDFIFYCYYVLLHIFQKLEQGNLKTNKQIKRK